MEQLLVQADNLNREAALLSNTLHTFRDDDLQAVRPVINQVIQKREAWKRVRAKIEYFQKTGKFPDEVPEQKQVSSIHSGTISELKLEVNRLSNIISKTKRKLELTPDHKKAEQWQEDMAKLEATKTEIKTKIIELTYATT
jgi:hypothetical protein